MSLFRQTSAGDFDFSSKGLVVVSEPAEATAQRLTNRFRLVEGEWQYDTRQGTPYFQRILGVSGNDLSVVRSLVEKIARETPGVKSVDSCTAELHADRTCDVILKCTADDGSTIIGSLGNPFIVT